MSVSVPCAHCKGSGRRDLTDLEQQTLAAVSTEWRTTSEVKQHINVVETQDWVRLREQIGRRAVLMRLTRLYDLGLIERKSHTEGHYAWRIKP